ncbi:MAG: 6-bladed beta-propeller [Acidobacteria bacterium]|nr:6-bladed beta-propeller [Acidobacteriota bacterium]
MKTAAAGFAVLLVCAPALAQRPSDPAKLIPQVAPLLDYVAVPDPLTLPAGMALGPSSSAAFDAQGHLWVLTRGPHPLMEFDANGRFMRSIGESVSFGRTHGLRIDPDGNFWVTDVLSHFVVKLSPQGETLLTLGTKGQRGDWDEAKGTHLLNEPNGVAVSRNGDVFIAQGHTPVGGTNAHVLKFDKNGKFIKSWGGKGTEPGKFAEVHGIAIDAKDQVWAIDRFNQRIQIFDTDGNYIRENKYAGTPCGISIGTQNIYLVNGFAGQILRLDLNGKVLAATEKAVGKGLGLFGEAHNIAVSPNGDLYVADPSTSSVHKFVKK